MAFPLVENSATTAVAGSSVELNMPAHDENDGLLLLAGIDNASISSLDDVNGVSWSLLTTVSSTCRFEIWYLEAGSDDGSPSTITCTLSTTDDITAAILTISGVDHTTTWLDIETTEEFTGSNYDPPELTPSWGSDDNLWLTGCCSANGGASITGPSGYSEVVNIAPGGAGTKQAIAIYEKDSATGTENPGTGTIGIFDDRIPFTIGVRPVGAIGQTVTVPLIEPATIFTPPTLYHDLIQLPTVSATTVFTPSIAKPAFIAVGNIKPVTIYNPRAYLNNQFIGIPLYQPLTVYQPRVAYGRIIGLDLLTPVTIYSPQNLNHTVALGFIEPTTIFEPFVYKDVNIQVNMYLGISFSAYLNIVLDVDKTPDNDNPLVVTGTLQLAADANSGDTTLTLTATTLTGTVEAGDTLTISGNTFTITESAVAASNQITVSIFPGMDDEIVLTLQSMTTVYDPSLVGS